MREINFHPRLVILKFCCKQQNLILADLAAYKNGEDVTLAFEYRFLFSLEKIRSGYTGPTFSISNIGDGTEDELSPYSQHERLYPLHTVLINYS